MKIRLRVDIEDQYWRGGAIIEVPSVFIAAFKPLKTTDDPLLAWPTGDIYVCSQDVKKVVELRKDAAKMLSTELAKMIINEMEKNDTFNGYEKDE